MIKFLPELIDAGIKSFKIEGRSKSLYYTSICTKIYREALDDCLKDKSLYEHKKQYYFSELEKISHREYSTGFYFGDNVTDGQIYDSGSYIQTYDFVGIILEFNEETFIATVEQRNKISIGDELEIISPYNSVAIKVEELYNEDDCAISVAPHAQQIIKIKLNCIAKPMDILRRIIKSV
jgi:putative protease